MNTITTEEWKRFGRVFKELEHGDPISDDDLNWFLKATDGIDEILQAISPAYALVARDLRNRRMQLQDFKDARQRQKAGKW